MSEYKKNLLLHICCAPCSTHVIELLKPDYDISGYFYNPNIHPKGEYLKRKGEMERYAERIKLNLACGEYDDEKWFELTKGLDKLPEGSERCLLCYEMRLDKSAKYAKEHNIEYIATTLSISPHKDAGKINQVGIKISDLHQIKFLAEDFKKKGGFEKSIKISKQYNLYRQSYCGCLFSKLEAEKRISSKRK